MTNRIKHGDRIAAKPDDQKALAHVHMRCTLADKDRWSAAAKGLGMTLSQFMAKAADSYIDGVRCLFEIEKKNEAITSELNDLIFKWQYYQNFCKSHGANSITDLVVQRDELLAALESVVEYYGKQGTGRVFNLGYGNDSALEQNLKSAIANAKGEL